MQILDNEITQVLLKGSGDGANPGDVPDNNTIQNQGNNYYEIIIISVVTCSRISLYGVK